MLEMSVVVPVTTLREQISKFLQFSLTNAFLLSETKQTQENLGNITILGASKFRYIEELLA